MKSLVVTHSTKMYVRTAYQCSLYCVVLFINWSLRLTDMRYETGDISLDTSVDDYLTKTVLSILFLSIAAAHYSTSHRLGFLVVEKMAISL